VAPERFTPIFLLKFFPHVNRMLLGLAAAPNMRSVAKFCNAAYGPGNLHKIFETKIKFGLSLNLLSKRRKSKKGRKHVV
jgi:hypothetical protein